MAINNVSAQHNGGFLPDMIVLTQCYYLPSRNPFKYHEEVLSCSLPGMIPPKGFDISLPSDWGMLRRSRCVQIFP